MSLYDASLPAPDPYSEAYAVQPNNGETGEPAAAAPAEAPQDAEGPRRDRSRSRSPGLRRGSRSRSRERRRSPVPPKRPAHAPVNPNPSSVLGVFGLSIRTQERDLEEEFSRYGTVEKVTIVYDQRSDRSRGFGFIRMATPEDAGRCIERLNGVDLNGRRIRVDYSVTDRPHQPTPGEYMGHRRRDDDRYRGSGSDYRGSGGGGGGGSRGYDRDRDRGRRDDFGRDSERRDGWRDRRSPRRYSRSPRRRSYSRSPERRDRDRDRDRSDRDRSDRDRDRGDRGDRDRDRDRDRSDRDRDRESRW